MYHHTVVKVRATNAEEAIADVNSLFDTCGDGHTFDYFDEEATCISEKCKNEEDWAKLRAKEIEVYKQYLNKALALEDNAQKAYLLIRAGEALDDCDFESTCRLCYDHAGETQADDEGDIFYIETVRHL